MGCPKKPRRFSGCGVSLPIVPDMASSSLLGWCMLVESSGRCVTGRAVDHHHNLHESMHHRLDCLLEQRQILGKEHIPRKHLRCSDDGPLLKRQ